MKKYFAIFAAIAILGMLTIYFVPEKKIIHATTSSVAATSTSPIATTSTATTPTTATNTTPTSSSSSMTSSSNMMSTYKNGTYNGSTASTPYGDVQVSITVSGGNITNVAFLNLPNQDRHSSQISSQVSPILKSQTLSAQSANINGVSGATYTTDGYIQSLQAAIDAAHV